MNGGYQRYHQPVTKPVRNRSWVTGAFWAVALIIVLAIAIPACGSYFKTETVTTVINSHERVCDDNGGDGVECKYLVFTEAGTFRLQDSLVIGRFDSSDLYGRIKDGQTYTITSYGWRFGCTSSYPNIKNMELVTK